MAFIIETLNVLEPTNINKHSCAGGITLRKWLEMRHPGFIEFPFPTYILVNGLPVVRSGWDHVIQPDDIINIITCPADPWTIAIVIAVAAIALSIAFALTIEVPKTPGEQPASDPVFSTRGQQNTIRLGEPIECPYGRNRIYPSIAMRPYFQYKDNEQFQYSVMCIGQGEYEIHDIFIGDTPIDSFAEVEYEIVPPGGNVSLFPSKVYTAIETG